MIRSDASVSTASPYAASQTSSSDHIAIDIDALVAAQGTSKRHADSPVPPRRTEASSSHPGTGNSAPRPRSATSLKLQGLLIRGANNELVREGKRSNSASGEANLRFLRQAIPHLLAARQAETAAYLEEIKQLLALDELKQPSAASGTITRDAEGRLDSVLVRPSSRPCRREQAAGRRDFQRRPAPVPRRGRTVEAGDDVLLLHQRIDAAVVCGRCERPIRN